MSASEPRQVVTTPIVACDGDRIHRGEDELVVEEPLEIRVLGRPVSVTMRTPGHDAELAVGFLLTEGLIAGRDDVRGIHADAESGNVVDIALRPGLHVDFERLSRHVFAASSCGICGKASIDAIRVSRRRALAEGVRVEADVLRGMPDVLRAEQTVFGRTGGLHAAGLFDLDGRLLAIREDVGRHNAVDKIIGHAVLNADGDGLAALTRSVLVVSGRGGFEIIQKALVAAIPIVAAVSAPSSLAVNLARETGQTLIGFLRGQRFVIYAGESRVGLALAGSRDV